MTECQQRTVLIFAIVGGFMLMFWLVLFGIIFGVIEP